MSIARRNAIAAAIIWALILGGLITAVIKPGAANFTAPEQQIWRILTAIIILPGFLLNAYLGWRSRRGLREGELDERDEAIARRASEATLIVVAILVYLTAIILYETHLPSGTVPTGWMYLLAYGTAALISLVHALATLIVDLTGAADG